MRSIRLFAYLAAVAVLFTLPLSAERELRGLAVRGADWAYEEGTASRKEAIANIIAGAHDNGYNAVFFQVREAGERFYPSESGSWSTLLDEQDPGFDPLEHALKEARRQGLQFYAVMDVLTAYSHVNKPASPQHVYAEKGKKWVLADNDFQPLRAGVYDYLDPSNPEVISYLKARVKELAENYALDGFWFTGLKYPGPAVLRTAAFGTSYEDVKSFSGREPAQYARDVLTSLLEALCTEARLMKPYLAFMAEVEPLPHEERGFRDLQAADSYWLQDGIAWLEAGIIDVLVPRLHRGHRDAGKLYDLYRAGTELGERIIPSLRGGEEDFDASDVKRTLKHIAERKGSGAILSPASDALKEGSFYPDAAELPYLAHTHTETKAVQIDLSAFHIPEDIVRAGADGRCRLVDQYNILNLSLPELPHYLTLRSMQDRLRYRTRGWTPPYRYVAVTKNTLQRPEVFIELRRAPDLLSVDSSYSFLFRASEGETRINDTFIEPYSHTRIFFKEIALAPYGRSTRIRGSVRKGERYEFYEDIYFGNMPDTSTKHAVITESVSPRGSVVLPEDDHLRISFSSDMAEAMDTILLYANGTPYPLWYNGSRYVGELACARFTNVDSAYIQVAARDTNGRDYSYDLPVSLKVRPEYSFPLIETTEDFVPASYSRGVVRLGGPYINEYPKGVRFVSNGRFGDVYRVRLNADEYAYIHERYVKSLPAAFPRPFYNITSISAAPDSNADRVVIPWPEPVPYAVFPEPGSGRIRIRLYGVQSNSTWITHRKDLRIVENVSWEQKDAETYDVLVHLKDSNIWGYELRQAQRFLSLRVKYPPQRNDMLIAVEAGHGGEWNWGAVGLSGLKEKDVNLDVTEKVRDMLREMGYNVAELRPGDSDPRLRERWLLADSLQADVFVSIHANAAGGGYLRVDGTSTYYHNPFWREFAEIAYDKLLELPLEEFGKVGSFNYMMCRMSQRPSMLVEQAFMSHAEDENKLADPEFRTRMAQKIAEAVNTYINRKLADEE